jgi:hypothetical protein
VIAIPSPEDVHEAINKAIAMVKEIYKDEDISDVELEEIEREGGDWLVTVGFNRQRPRTVLGGLLIPQRTLKVVRIDRDTGEFKGMKISNPIT